MAGEDRRQAFGQLLEGGPQVGVVLVGVARHEASRQEDGHRLFAGQAERREQATVGQAKPAVLRPDRQEQLILDRLEVPIDRSLRHPDGGRDLLGCRPAIASALEEANDPVEACRPVALGAQPVPLVDAHLPSLKRPVE